jgi:hypothetical protein
LKERYLGTQAWTSGDRSVKGVDEFEFQIEQVDEDKDRVYVQGRVVWRRIRVDDVGGADPDYLDQVSYPLDNDKSGTEIFSGHFEKHGGLLLLKGQSRSPDEEMYFGLSNYYRLLVSPDGCELSGVSQSIPGIKKSFRQSEGKGNAKLDEYLDCLFSDTVRAKAF